MKPLLHWTEPDREQALRAEIRAFEIHLERIESEDDSAYAKARIRMYESLLQERRHQLDALTAMHSAQAASHDYL